ncbi:NAD(P)H-dependent flavin oxidoreductase [Dactylosporangium sp. CS-033363]|uniref:NAD(P)H-dependent flavin oxidoreductase n=1 Tax=Dactylosporangium sp. CS-033363 TaxID=3239935 RepID=UPI003D8D6FC5
MRTAFTELLGVPHPLALAPMGGSAGGALAGAVTRAGGLGLLGAGGGDPDWLARELPLVAASGGPWGAGFLTWAVGAGAVERVLEHGARAIMFSFGDPSAFIPPVRAAGATLILQVTTLEEARRALELGADAIVAQGTEAGGHGSVRGRSTLPFVPLVVDLVAPVPVLAAGGIADGRGLAAALCLGAAGALIGTRFQATPEALVDPAITKALLDGRGDETERSRVLDIVRGSQWPAQYAARTLGSPYLDRYRDDPAAAAEARDAYAADVERGVVPPLPVWAGEGVDLITDVLPATDLVARIVAEAEEALARASATRSPRRPRRRRRPRR